MKKYIGIALAVLMVLGLSGMAMADNIVDIDQDAYGAYVHTAYVAQVGGDNVVDVQQLNGHHLYVTINQVGNRNTIETNVGTTDPVFDTNSFVVTLPTITAGFGKATQRSNPYKGGTKEIVLDQFGDDNTVGLFQDGGYNFVDICQSGHDNEVLLWQGSGTGVPTCIATIDQNGYDNSLKAYQSTNNGYNYVNASQTGYGNHLLSWQSATNGYNDLNVSQSGGSSATVIQIATFGNNVATVTQY